MHKITLTPSEAQHGFVRQLGNVDGTKWHISGDGPTNIAHKLVIPGHGLPLVSAPQSRGSLEISLHVAFPKVTSKLMLMQKFETDKLRQEGGPFFAKLKHVHNAEVHTSFLGKQQDGNLDSTVLYGYPWK
jgi:DnaJ-class molecular chaperone